MTQKTKRNRQSRHARASTNHPTIHAASIYVPQRPNDRSKTATCAKHAPPRAASKGRGKTVRRVQLVILNAAHTGDIGITRSHRHICKCKVGRHLKNHWPRPIKKRLQPPPAKRRGHKGQQNNKNTTQKEKTITMNQSSNHTIEEKRKHKNRKTQEDARRPTSIKKPTRPGQQPS